MEIKKYKTIASTNIVAKELANTENPWTVIVAESQDSGHGTRGASWFSPKGGLYFSVILPKGNLDDLQTLTLLAAFTVSKVIKDKFNLEPMIKLPNDVFVNGKKVCGILTDNVIGDNVKASVIGIGLNTNIRKFDDDLKGIATSLIIELGKEVDNEMLLKEIVLGLEKQFKIISQ